MKFSKQYIGIQDQIQLLKRRGLQIDDVQEAAHYLKFISYFRLSGYFFHFQKKDGSQSQEDFVPGSNFKTILQLYIFDRELRLLVMDALERIEVAFRTQLMNEMCQRYGPHWFMEQKHFVPQYKHSDLLNKLEGIRRECLSSGAGGQTKSEPFISHYLKTYQDPIYPPCWMISEVLSLQTWSVIYSKLKYRDVQKVVASQFGVSNEVLSSWMHCITYLRNMCAHHARLWRRVFTIKPKQAVAFSAQLQDNSKFYAQAVILFVLMRRIAPDTEWNQRLKSLFVDYPDVLPSDVGFPTNWISDRFWGLMP